MYEYAEDGGTGEPLRRARHCEYFVVENTGLRISLDSVRVKQAGTHILPVN